MERRAGIELRAVGRKLEGYAAVFDQEARVADFREIILPGAFSDTIKGGRDILALSDHDASKVLARTKSGTLRLAEDTRGLHFSLDVPDTTAGRDVLALAERGDIGGASFGFQVPKGGERRSGDLRTLTAIDLFEISIISSWPAYDGTVVQARNRQALDDGRRLALARWRA